MYWFSGKILFVIIVIVVGCGIINHINIIDNICWSIFITFLWQAWTIYDVYTACNIGIAIQPLKKCLADTITQANYIEYCIFLFLWKILQSWYLNISFRIIIYSFLSTISLESYCFQNILATSKQFIIISGSYINIIMIACDVCGALGSWYWYTLNYTWMITYYVTTYFTIWRNTFLL